MQKASHFCKAFADWTGLINFNMNKPIHTNVNPSKSFVNILRFINVCNC